MYFKAIIALMRHDMNFQDDKINFELIIIAERETNEFMFLSMI